MAKKPFNWIGLIYELAKAALAFLAGTHINL